MTSLNALITVGAQISEAILEHEKINYGVFKPAVDCLYQIKTVRGIFFLRRPAAAAENSCRCSAESAGA